MAANASSSAFDVTDPRVRTVLGVVLGILSMVGLAGLFPNVLEPWASWFLMIALFFLGITIMMHGLSSMD